MSAAQQQPKPSGVWLTIKPFVNGGLSGMAATCIIQPIDMIKVRKQLGAQGSAVSICCRSTPPLRVDLQLTTMGIEPRVASTTADGMSPAKEVLD
jgi:hypothetical protein